MPEALARGGTAEDVIAELREGLVAKIGLAELILRPLHARASEAEQILMVRYLDETREAERLLGALAVAKRHLEMPIPPKPEGISPRGEGG